ncbi:MAG: adenosylcobinamide-phosphate synthase CbiB [Roseobacter sp.]|jgi:adenosylcobinamide-phosphate synthase|nr:adenosylcobinamide-phosphate synthase CbiB [Roseobacter sp.]
MTTPLLLLLAMLLDAFLGEPKWLWSRAPHPAVLMGRLVARLDHALNHGDRRRLKGVLCLFLLVAAGAVTGAILALFGPVVEVICAAILLAQKSLVDHVRAVADGLRDSLTDGRRAVAMIVSRDTAAMDESATARAAIESASENLSDGVIAPAFWFLVGGLPALMAYKCINTADSMIGYKTPKYAEFGWASARMDDLVNLIPARLTALLIALAGGSLPLRQIRRDARLHRSPNAGWPEAAMARTLGCALAGPRAYDGAMRDFPWVNQDGKRSLGPLDIDASIVMLWKAWGLMLGLCAVLAFFMN